MLQQVINNDLFSPKCFIDIAINIGCYISFITDNLKTMTKEERHNAILEQLLKKAPILVSELAETLDVSLVTIRKDLTELENMGKLYRSHGKAIAINPFTINRTVNEKEKLAPEEKHAIGHEAAKLIEANDFIIIGSGTTVQAFARAIHPTESLTVVTASLQTALVLSQDKNIEVMQLGGTVRTSSQSVVGDYSEMLLNDCTASKVFLGVDGIDLDYGFTTTDLREAHLNKKMMQAAQKTIVITDSSKFGKRGFAKIGNIEDIDIVVTDTHVSDIDVKRLEEMGIRVIKAQYRTML